MTVPGTHRQERGLLSFLAQFSPREKRFAQMVPKDGARPRSASVLKRGKKLLNLRFAFSCLSRRPPEVRTSRISAPGWD